MKRFIFLLLALVLFTSLASAQEARLMRYPDIHKDKVVFAYAGDLWLVSSEGGIARRLTSHPGLEYGPKFSPDGKYIAFTASYDGNKDVFVIPSTGGEPKKLTFHPGIDELVDWYPDGKNLLFRSTRNSFSYRFNRHHKVSIEGGFPQLIPLPEAELASFNSDGSKVAYNRLSRENRTWKRYRGGTVQEVWVYDFAKNEIENISNDLGTDAFPMWQGNNIYFVSDRDENKKLNLFAYDTTTKALKKITNYGKNDYDVKWPSIGPDAIIYEQGGWLYVHDLKSGEDKKINVEIYDDKTFARPTIKNVKNFIHNFTLSPTGQRALLEARGDIFTVPAEKGNTRNLTQTPGIREMDPVWSPDGKYVAYFSDRTGEFQVYIRPSDGKGEEKQLTKGLKSYLQNLAWSPDNKKLLFSDVTNTLHYIDVETGTIEKVFHNDHNGTGNFVSGSWSPDSNWIAYHNNDESSFSSIYLYELKTKKSHRVTSELTDDVNPAFDPDGKYLYWIANREFNFGTSVFEASYYHEKPGKVVVTTLQKDTPNPFAPESDEEKIKEEKKEEKKADDKKADAKDPKAEAKDPKADAKDEKKKEEDKSIKIDLDGLEERMVNLDVPDGNYFGLMPLKDSVIYAAFDNGLSLHIFDMKKRESKLVMAGIQGASLSADGKKLLYRMGPNFGIVAAAPGQKPGKSLDLSDLQMTVDYKAEWRQIYYESWRQFRDFFYDRNMHGVDWDAMKKRYEVLLPYVAHRDDLHYVVGELIGELNSGHTYRSGGDFPTIPRTSVGVLACDFEVDAAAGLYKISKIYKGQSWDPARQSPLAKPGLKVKEGDYLLAVNGKTLKAPANPFALLVNTTGKNTVLTVNSKPEMEGAEEIVVKPIGDDSMHRYIDWVMGNIEKVNKASNGQIGYIQVPDTAGGGMEWFNRLFFPQVSKKALIVDARYNSGGFIPDIYLERLARRLLNLWSTPYSKGFREPGASHIGPKVCLTNAWAGSGGDAFPYYFKKLKLGPVIGTRSWGGLIGISGNPILMDNGSVSVPDFAFVDTDGNFAVENEGVTPDIVLDNRPDLVINGQDPQLEKAIEVLLKALKEQEKKPIADTPTRFPIR